MRKDNVLHFSTAVGNCTNGNLFYRLPKRLTIFYHSNYFNVFYIM